MEENYKGKVANLEMLINAKKEKKISLVHCEYVSVAINSTM